MVRKKFDILNLSLDKVIFGFLIGLASFTLNFTFSQNSFAEYKATLSASVNESNASINGTEIIESSDETAEHNINLKINTTNKTGYTATFSSKTDETALLNTNPAINTKIDSISSNYALANFPANTWGYRFDDNAVFSPIPAKSASVNLIKTTEKSTSEENHNIKLGMKLNSSLKPGNYENRLIVSVVSNPYTPKAVMTGGWDFNDKFRSLETIAHKVKHFKRSPIGPTTTVNALNVEDADSDYEIKLWLDETDDTAYYYSEPERVYLNRRSNFIFCSYWGTPELKEILDIDVSGFDTSMVENMEEMFYGLSKIKTIDVSNFDTSKATNMDSVFKDMSSITSLDLSNFNTSNVDNMEEMFSGMTSLTSLNVSSFDTSKVRRMYDMFYHVSSIKTLDLSNFDTSNVRSMARMFCGAKNIVSLDLSNFDTSNVTTMGAMFYENPSLTTLNISNFNTSKVEYMGGMFGYDSSLKTLDLSSFDTSNVKDMGSMFRNMSNLTSLNLANFNTSNVTDMENMFFGVSKITSLDLSSFDTRNVTDMSEMFAYMPNLTALNLSNFDTSQVTNMYCMFYNMLNLTTLDLSNFDTSQVTIINSIFALSDYDKHNDKLEVIYVNNDFDTTKLVNTGNVFYNRNKLRGGNGSFLTNPRDADLTWLRVDRPGVQGYFTKKA